MNSGKSTALLQAAYNYEERGQRVALAKPSVDSKGDHYIISRLGVKREVDLLVSAHDNLRTRFRSLTQGEDPNSLMPNIKVKPIAALLVDEAQFFTPKQVDDMFKIAVLDNVPVLSYGIRTDFRTTAFPGAHRLLEIAHTLEELKTICRCGRKAIFNGRRVNGHFIFSGEQVAIDGVKVTYESLCGACYLAESGGVLEP